MLWASTVSSLHTCGLFLLTPPGCSHVGMPGGGLFQANLEQQILNLMSWPHIVIQGNCREGFVVNESSSAAEILL